MGDGTKHAPGLITAVQRGLQRMEERVDQPVRRRPWWQRILLPMAGVLLVATGLAFLLSPIPLAVLAVVGFPLLGCFHPRVEAWTRQRLGNALEAAKERLGRLRRRRRQAVGRVHRPRRD